MEQEMQGFLTFTLRPWLVLIEQSMNKSLLTPAERLKYYVEFSIEGLLRADSNTRAEFYSKMVNNGIYTRDEVREKRIYRNAAVSQMSLQFSLKMYRLMMLVKISNFLSKG